MNALHSSSLDLVVYMSLLQLIFNCKKYNKTDIPDSHKITRITNEEASHLPTLVIWFHSLVESLYCAHIHGNFVPMKLAGGS